MKKIFTILIIMLIIFIYISCEPTAEENTEYEYNFLDQDLQGFIDRKPWKLDSGVAYINDSFKLTYKMLTNFITDATCDIKIHSVDFGDWAVYFDAPVKTGLFKLGEKIDKVHFKKWINESNSTTRSTDVGAIEIISIDETNYKVKGRMDVYDDKNTNINGNFQVGYCNIMGY